jgi:1,4-dihydroxy-6-naphthoate synthase
MKLTIGFSPCPNDTFIFDAMVNGKIDTKGFEFEVLLADVETLNQWAEEGKLGITKLSYHAFLHNIHHYALLHSGSALGKGVGPLLVCKKENAVLFENNEWRERMKVCIPGKNTTANLLLSLSFPEINNKIEVVFSEIEQAVLNSEFDAGLIIHESRFTYQSKGLHKLIDLGDWWETNMNAMIPLGGIVVKRNIDKTVASAIDSLIQESIRFAWKNYPALSDYVTCHAQEMEEEVMRQHINLYVNKFSEDLGEEGSKAIYKMFEKAVAIGVLEKEKNYRDLIFY